MTRIGVSLAVLLAGVTACGSDGSTGENTPAATFTEIYAQLFPATTNPRCNFCHSMPATNVNNGSLHMGSDKDTAWNALVGKSSAGAKCTGKPLVVPGDPSGSLFFQKLGAAPPCGDRMPLGGAALSDAQLEMIRSWIAAGAPND